MTMELDRETQRLIEEEIRSGRYRSAGDVVRDVLRLMEEQNQLLLGRKEEIRKEIAAGLESLRRGKAWTVRLCSIASNPNWTHWSAAVSSEGVHPLFQRAERDLRHQKLPSQRSRYFGHPLCYA